MNYKISLENKSFIIAEDNTKLPLYLLCFRLHIYAKILYKYTYLYKLLRVKSKGNYNRFTIERYIGELKCGQYKMSQDIQKGDFVIGVDGKPSCVLELHRGKEKMARIIINDNEYVVNVSHILFIMNKETKQKFYLPVYAFLQLPKEERQKYIMVRVLNE